jgi:dihydroxyacetone kinase DhaKLM complex PTS-EIIA-like component DhaM
MFSPRKSCDTCIELIAQVNQNMVHITGLIGTMDKILIGTTQIYIIVHWMIHKTISSKTISVLVCWQ